MKVVGLLSGGKDSIYNLLNCVLNGHEVVCLANLRPPPDQDELDSYMYQTVGNSGLKCIAEAMDLPLITKQIVGSALNQESTYGSRSSTGGVDSNDETEDLYQLLLQVKQTHPNVRGVACGAILSNYQRVRVEHVCSRLGLVPIAYLWERDQQELLSEMVAAEMNSILVKVAGAGLTTDHLGKSLAQMQPILHRLNQRYQLHLCGEGGEYETLTLDCPLFKQRVSLDETQAIVLDQNPFSTVAYLHIDKCSVQPKQPNAKSLHDLVTRPPLLDEQSQHMLGAINVVRAHDTSAQVSKDAAMPSEVSKASVGHIGKSLVLAEVVCSSPSARSTLAGEVQGAFECLIGLLAQHDHDLTDLSHISLFISKEAMEQFGDINKVYASYFGSSPPTRACVATVLPEGLNIKIEAFATKADPSGPAARKALHVQSLSYWAAANIGPYSQAVTADGTMYVSGQIPLVPADLSLFDGAFGEQAVLALQHLRRVADSAKERREVTLRSAICWLAEVQDDECGHRLAVARQAWKAFAGDCPIVFVQSPALPKGASIEWQAVYNARLPDEEEDSTQIDRHQDHDQILLPGSKEGAGSVLLHVRVFHTPGYAPSQARAELTTSLGCEPTSESYICSRHVATMDSTDLPVVFSASWRTQKTIPRSDSR